MFTLRTVLNYVRPRFGRFTAKQMTRVAELLEPPAFLAVGPFLVLMDLPKKYQKQDPGVFDLAAHLAQINRRNLSN